jgi:hypothetical protein
LMGCLPPEQFGWLTLSLNFSKRVESNSLWVEFLDTPELMVK